METLPETIEDLLSIAASAAGSIAASALPVAARPASGVSLVVLARKDGELTFVEDFGGESPGKLVADLARGLVEHLADQTTSQWEMATPSGPRRALAQRLPAGGPVAFAACLLESATKHDGPLSAAETSAVVCGSVAWVAAQYASARRELQARVEQLVAGHAALHTSYSRSLTETLEEHEARLREREKAEADLKRLHAFNRLILDSAGEGIVGIDDQGHVVFINPAADRMLGWPPADMIGKPLHRLVQHTKANGRPYAWEDSPLCRTLREGAAQRIDQEVFWRKDGGSFPVEYVITPMRDEQEIVGAVLTFQDITERRLLEGQLVQAQKLESIGQLAAGIAHEINTPTQFIGDNLRFLEDAFADLQLPLAANRRLAPAGGQDGGRISPLAASLREVLDALQGVDLEYLLEEIPKAIAQSLEGVERVAKIVRSMKEFSHPGTDEMQPVDLNKALESTLTVCRNEWKYVADVVTDFDPDLPLVTCLPGECNQMFLNLIINAAHAIADKQVHGGGGKGRITVSTRLEGEWVEVRIADTGTGIAEEHRIRVFDPFFTTKKVGRGTGQGLAIARSVLVDKHGGALSFETEVGRGTTFIVRLPRRDSAAREKGAGNE